MSHPLGLEPDQINHLLDENDQEADSEDMIEEVLEQEGEKEVTIPE